MQWEKRQNFWWHVSRRRHTSDACIECSAQRPMQSCQRRVSAFHYVIKKGIPYCSDSSAKESGSVVFDWLFEGYFKLGSYI